MRAVRLDVRRPLRAVEDVIRGEVDERRPERGDVRSAADVHGRRALRIVLRSLDVGPPCSVQGEIQVTLCHLAGGGISDVPRSPVQRDDVVAGEGLGERDAELAARAGDQDPLLSRSDRIGDFVLQRSITRGSSHGNPFSSGSAASYSSVTWYSIRTSVKASKPCARLPGT